MVRNKKAFPCGLTLPDRGEDEAGAVDFGPRAAPHGALLREQALVLSRGRRQDDGACGRNTTFRQRTVGGEKTAQPAPRKLRRKGRGRTSCCCAVAPSPSVSVRRVWASTSSAGGIGDGVYSYGKSNREWVTTASSLSTQESTVGLCCGVEDETLPVIFTLDAG